MRLRQDGWKKMFKEELAGLPVEIQEALRDRLQEVIRLIYQRHNHALKDSSINHYTKEEISAMIYGVFDLAERLKNLRSLA